MYSKVFGGAWFCPLTRFGIDWFVKIGVPHQNEGKPECCEVLNTESDVSGKVISGRAM